MKQNLIERLREIITEFNYFELPAGERFKKMYSINDINAMISFSGRSKKHENYSVASCSSDGDVMYVTHLYIDNRGNVKVQLSSEDNDDLNNIFLPYSEPIENYDDETVREWIELLDYDS